MSNEKTNLPLKKVNSQEIKDFLIAEYSALREEILKRIEFEFQTISLALIAPATIITIGLQTKNTSLMLLYPILGLFLSSFWIANSEAIRNLAEYIGNRVEARFEEADLGWEHFSNSNIKGKLRFNAPYFFGTRGVLIGTELLSILAGLSVGTLSNTEKIILIISVSSIVLSIIMLTFDVFQQRKKLPYLFKQMLANDTNSLHGKEKKTT